MSESKTMYLNDLLAKVRKHRLFLATEMPEFPEESAGIPSLRGWVM